MFANSPLLLKRIFLIIFIGFANMRFTLRQLQVFLAVARHENVSRAAEELALSQSAASGALQTLEQQYALQLFDRVGKRLQLNEAGHRLQGKVAALLEHASNLEQEFSASDARASISLGATLTIGNYLAVPLIAEYRHLHPGTQIQLLVENTEHIAYKLRHFAIDAALIEGVIHDDELNIEHWRDDDLVVFCAPEHPLAQQQTLEDADLLAADWILRETGSGTRQQVDYAFHDLLPELKVSMELQHTEAIKRSVELGLGISCLSRLTLETAFERGTLIPLEVPGRDFHRRLYLATHKQKFISPPLAAWLQFLRSAALPF